MRLLVRSYLSSSVTWLSAIAGLCGGGAGAACARAERLRQKVLAPQRSSNAARALCKGISPQPAQRQEKFQPPLRRSNLAQCSRTSPLAQPALGISVKMGEERVGQGRAVGDR